jgi:hypothetical protein
MNRRLVLAAAAAAPFVIAGCAAPLGFNPLPGGVNALVSGAQKHSGLSADQTAASLGAMFGLAQNALSPADFARLGTTLPGIGDLVTRGASVGGFTPSSLTSLKSVTDTLGKLNVNPTQLSQLGGYVTGALGGGGASGAADMLSKVWR